MFTVFLYRSCLRDVFILYFIFYFFVLSLITTHMKYLYDLLMSQKYHIATNFWGGYDDLFYRSKCLKSHLLNHIIAGHFPKSTQFFMISSQAFDPAVTGFTCLYVVKNSYLRLLLF